MSSIFYIPKHLRRKFNGNSLPGIFLGYDDINPTAYIIFDINNNKVILSRTVEFFEDTPGYTPAPSSTPEIVDFEIEEEQQDHLTQDYNENKNNNKKGEFEKII